MPHETPFSFLIIFSISYSENRWVKLQQYDLWGLLKHIRNDGQAYHQGDIFPKMRDNFLRYPTTWKHTQLILNTLNSIIPTLYFCQVVKNN